MAVEIDLLKLLENHAMGAGLVVILSGKETIKPQKMSSRGWRTEVSSYRVPAPPTCQVPCHLARLQGDGWQEVDLHILWASLDQ